MSEQVIKELKAKLRAERKKNKILRAENKEMWEKAETHSCCKHVHKKRKCLEIWPHHAYCQNCDSMRPMFFGEIMDDECTKRHVWLCHDCHNGEEPTSWGPPYTVLCKECVDKRQRKIDREIRRKELAEEREYWRRIKEAEEKRAAERAAEQEERLRKAAIEADKQRIIDLENAKRKRKTNRDARAQKRQRRYDPPGTVYEEDKPKPKPANRAASPVYRPGTPELMGRRQVFTPYQDYYYRHRPKPVNPKLPANMLPGNSSNSAYRYDAFKERLTEFYKRVKPDHVGKIPSILEKYKNKFELLSRKLLKKYPTQWKHVIWRKPPPIRLSNFTDIPLPDDDDY